MGRSPRADSLKRTFDRLKDNRHTWDSHWRTVSQVVFPAADDFYQRGFQNTRGERKNLKIYDATAMLSLDRFAGIMESLITPHTQRWHGLRSPLPKVAGNRRVRAFFEDVAHILFAERYAPRSGFQSQVHAAFKSVGAFGNGILFIDEDKERAGSLRYKSCFVGDTFFVQNHQGIVDTVYRRFDLSHENAIRLWGEDNVPDKVKQNFKTCPHDVNEYVHIVRPNVEFDPNRYDVGGMKYESIYLHYDECYELEVGGYRTFPYAIGRYTISPNEEYGRGPAMEVLPTILTLNEMKRTDLRASHKIVDPPLLMHDDGVLGGGRNTVNLNPGGLNSGGVNADGRPMIQPLQTGARVDINEQKMETERNVIRDAFLLTLFQILVDTPRMSATEAMIRAQEKGALLGPGPGRIMSEMFGAAVEREIDILAEAGKLPDPPPELVDTGGEFEVEFQNPLVRLQKANDMVGTQAVIDMATQIAQWDPNALRKIDTDQALEVASVTSGAPVRVLRSQGEVDAMMQAEAQQAQEQQIVEAAPQMAKAAKDLAQASQIRQGA